MTGPTGEWTLANTISRRRVPVSLAIAVGGLFLARPTLASIVVGCGVAMVGLLWRAWASGTIEKNAALAVDGPYALSRNPLYFGSFLIALGFGWASGNLELFAAIGVFFALVYVPVMRQEERELRTIFGPRFEDYVRRVPLFLPWPSSSPRDPPLHRFSLGLYWRNREYNALLGFAGAVAFLFAIKYLHAHSLRAQLF